MTDPDPRLDELLSAHLDGETTADEAARIERDPELIVRLEELASARDALAAAPPPLDDVTREATLARVFAALDHDEAAPALTPISELRRRRRDPSRLLAAAAAIIAVALLGGAIGMLARESGGDDSGSDSAATELSTKDDAGARAPATMTEEDTDSAADSSAGSSPRYLPTTALPSLGSFADTSQLSVAVQQHVFATRSSSQGGALAATEDGAATSLTLANCPAPPGMQAVYSAEVDRRLLFVVVTDEPVALVVDPQTCAEVLRITQQ